MSRALPSTPPLTSLPLAQLVLLASYEEDISQLSPRAWFDRTQHESNLAVLAERRGKKEEMFVAYTKCCTAYSNARMHPTYAQERKGDAHWAGRVKSFKETYDAYLQRATEVKESLKQRDVEKGEGSSRPTASRSSSTGGPEVHSMGSIADRMKALSGRGMDVAPSAKRNSVSQPSPLSAPPPSAFPSTNTGSSSGSGNRARAESTASSNHSQPDKPARPRGPSIPPKPSLVQGPRPADPSSSRKETPNRSRSNSKVDPPLTPGPVAAEARSPRAAPPALPSIPHSPPSSNLSAIQRGSIPSSPTRGGGQENGDTSVDIFEKQFPSLSEFGKQFEQDDFKPGANGLVGPFERVGEQEDGGDEDRLANLPDVPNFPNLPNVPDGLPSRSETLPPPPARPDRMDLSDDRSSSPPQAVVDVKRPASTANVASLPDQERKSPIPPALQSQPRINGPISPAPVFPEPKPAPAPSTSAPSLPPKPRYPLSNSIDPETIRSYVINPSAQILFLDLRSEDEYKKGYVGKEYESKGYNVAAIWLDPTVLMRNEMNSTRLEDSLSLLPDDQRKWFLHRHDFDLIIVYDATSTQWPDSGSTKPLERLWDIIYEHEFTKKLQRNPVLLVGGYQAWSKYQEKRAARYGAPTGGGVPGQPGHANGVNGDSRPNGQALLSPRLTERPLISPSPAVAESKRANRDVRVYQSVDYTQFGDNFASPPPDLSASQPSRSYLPQPALPSARSPQPPYAASSSPAGYTSPSITQPAPVSIHPGPGSRRRSDYVEHSTAAYSGSYPSHYPSSSNGYSQGPGGYPYTNGHVASPPAPHRGRIDYPAAHALNAAVPQLPPAVQGHAMERYDQHPNARPQTNRAPSIRAMDLMQREGDDVRYWNAVVLGLTGLKNLGNTCYMNSTLQCLSATYPFTSYFLDGSFRASINERNPLGMGGRLAVAFAELLKALWKEDYTFLSPVTFRKNIISFAQQFSGTDQHDSQEFLSFVLDGLHEDLNRIKVKPAPVEMTPEREARLETLPPEVASQQEWEIYRQRNDSFIVDLFQGQYRNRLECLTCHKTSTTFDTFMYMSLPVPAGKKAVVLQELIDEFVRAEIMEHDDAWHCPRCKVPRRASKTLTIARLPPVLLIQLKRFSTKNGVFWDKSETPVIFPVNSLDLSRYVPPRKHINEDLDDPRTQVGPFKYDLYGVSNHMGTLSSGHYTAYVKSAKGWYYCEDSKITKSQEKDVVSRPAYILFYKRIRT